MLLDDFYLTQKKTEMNIKKFSWTDLYKAGKMNCIDGGHFFICQTLANSDVKFGQNENYLTNTGIFGIWLHYGVVELKKIKTEK